MGNMQNKLLIKNHWMDWNHSWQNCSLQGPYQVLLLFVLIGHPTWQPGAIKASDWLKFQSSFRESLKQNRTKLGRNVPFHGLS